MQTKAGRNFVIMLVISALVIILTFVFSTVWTQLMMPIVVTGVSLTIFLAHNLATVWREFDRVRLLLHACKNELYDDLKLLKTNNGITDMGRSFVPIMWNIDTYKEVVRLLLMNQSQIYSRSDLEQLITLMRQDNAFQAKLWDIFGEDGVGVSLTTIAYKRNLIQEEIKNWLETIHSS